jgi:hypothetical protein
MCLKVWTFWRRCRKRRMIEELERMSLIHSSGIYLMSLLWTTVAKASASSHITTLVRSSPLQPGISRSPTQSSATSTS